MISVSCSLFVVLFFFQRRPPPPTGKSQVIPSTSRMSVFTPNKENPEKPSSSGTQQLYVMVIDSAFEQMDYHCLAYEQWMKPLMETGIIDAIEFYSLNAWHNKACNISSITVSVKSSGESSQFLQENLLLYLARSQAPWLFIVGDATYIHPVRFIETIGHHLDHVNPWTDFAMGNCVERRFYFQMFPIQSGILMSRNTVAKLLSQSEMWKVAIETELPAEETLSQILDAIHIPARNNHHPEFLGMPFRNRSHYEALATRNFAGLPPCTIPKSILNAESGVSRICATDIFPIRDVVTWAGAPEDASAAKLAFLKAAHHMLDDIPNNIRFYWDRLYPTLCDTHSVL